MGHPRVSRPHDGLRPGIAFELAEHRRNVIADRLFADPEALADGAIVAAFCPQLEHLQLASGERVERRASRAVGDMRTGRAEGVEHIAARTPARLGGAE